MNMTKICKGCIISMTCTQLCDKFYNMELKGFILTEEVIQEIHNNKLEEIFKNSETCLLCGNNEIVIPELIVFPMVAMDGYCSKCKAYYLKDSSTTEDLLLIGNKLEDDTYDERPEGDESEFLSFKEAIARWVKEGYL